MEKIELPSGGSLRRENAMSTWKYFSGNCIELRVLDGFEDEMVSAAFEAGGLM